MPKTPPDDIQDTNKVETPLPAYEDFMEVLKPLNTLMGGTRAMRAAGTDYLPQEAEEETADYNNRLNRSNLVNYFKRTVEKLGGEVFAKPLARDEDLDPILDEILDDVDNNGHDVTQFSLKSFKDGIKNGITHILIDYPQVRLKTEKGVKFFFDEKEADKSKSWKPWTRANEKELNYRPNWSMVVAEQIIGWRTEIKQGKVTLTQTRIAESTEEPDGEYGNKTVNRIRVFTPTTWEVHQQDDEGVYFLEKKGTNNLGYIPLVSVYLGERIKDFVVNPPLEGLADLNITHWQSNSDQRNILHYARLVIYFGKMIETENGKMVIGPNRFVLSTEPDSDLKVVEHNGKSIDAGRQDIIDLEKTMTMYGLTFMMPKTGSGTATERAIDSSENDSSLKSWALSMEDALNKCIQITADYLGKEGTEDSSISINTEFKSFLMGAEASLLLEAADKNIIPKAIVVEEFIRRGILKEDTDPLELEVMLNKERMESMEFMTALSASRSRPAATDNNDAGDTNQEKPMEEE